MIEKRRKDGFSARNFLNHMEGIYRPGDRELTVELVEALGLVTANIQFTE